MSTKILSRREPINASLETQRSQDDRINFSNILLGPLFSNSVAFLIGLMIIEIDLLASQPRTGYWNLNKDFSHEKILPFLYDHLLSQQFLAYVFMKKENGPKKENKTD